MKTILLFGAGKSATVLIDYLLIEAPAAGWHIQVVDADLELVKSKINKATCATPLSFDIRDAALRAAHISAADLVISLLPPHLHIEVARDCVHHGKSLLTASYLDASIRALQPAIEEKGLLFLYEMGLDPGIDHMSAMQLIDDIHAKGGTINSFISHCGGLVAPESDDNPWHYKISWNPRNVVLAGKAGAIYRENGTEKKVPYAALFNAANRVHVPGLEPLSWYPNRDSLGYISLYGLQQCHTFIRTTLRHPDFMSGWNTVIALKLTDESPAYDSDGKTLRQLFKEHLNRHGLSDWLNKTSIEQFNEPTIGTAAQPHAAGLIHQQLLFLGFEDDKTLVNKGHCSAADLLQLALEMKLVLYPEDRDMIVMLHEISYTLNDKSRTVNSSLVVKGENSLRTAMAKTVGMPLGIAAKLMLEGKLRQTGLRIPVSSDIYNPVLEELARHGIRFHETMQ